MLPAQCDEPLGSRLNARSRACRERRMLRRSLDSALIGWRAPQDSLTQSGTASMKSMSPCLSCSLCRTSFAWASWSAIPSMKRSTTVGGSLPRLCDLAASSAKLLAHCRRTALLRCASWWLLPTSTTASTACCCLGRLLSLWCGCGTTASSPQVSAGSAVASSSAKKQQAAQRMLRLCWGTVVQIEQRCRRIRYEAITTQVKSWNHALWAWLGRGAVPHFRCPISALPYNACQRQQAHCSTLPAQEHTML